MSDLFNVAPEQRASHAEWIKNSYWRIFVNKTWSTHPKDEQHALNCYFEYLMACDLTID